MLNVFKQKLQTQLEKALAEATKSDGLPPLELEVPADKAHGDYSTNIALRSAKVLRKQPADIGKEFLEILTGSIRDSELSDYVAKIDLAGPGFINFTLTPKALQDVLVQVFKENERFGQSTLGKKRKVQIEFVSANPTGPLSVA